MARLLDTKATESDDWIDGRAGDLFLGLDLQHRVISAQMPFLRGLHRDGVHIQFIVYDLLPVQFPSYWPAENGMDKSHAQWLSDICNFDGAVCISRAVADELDKWRSSNRPNETSRFKISWFHLGADLERTLPTRGLPDGASEVLKRLEQGVTFLMVGTVEPRKGHKQVLAGFEALWKKGVDINLAIVGKLGWLMDDFALHLRNHQEFDRKLLWINDASDEYLAAIYQASQCLLVASEGEGFGLPLVEAAKYGLPVIARDLPVFREVADSGAHYFSGLQPDDLAQCIEDWLKLHEQGLQPRPSEIRVLTWRDSATQLKVALTKSLDTGVYVSSKESNGPVTYGSSS